LRNIDFTSWQSVIATLVGLALVTLIGVGIRLLVMTTVQQRRERLNRQINERLRTLIAAYRTLGGSFTGDLTANPAHLRDLQNRGGIAEADDNVPPPLDLGSSSDRTRRIRDAVEAALADIILLGTQAHVALARQAACELVAGRPVHTHALVVSLRDFIRDALDLDPIPADLRMPIQGPTRPGSNSGKGKEEGKQADRNGGGGGGGAGGAGAMGMGMAGGIGAGVAVGEETDQAAPERNA
jgi:uncharacterized membrane protein YgcG